MSGPRIALLGLGEAGSEIARDLVTAGTDVRGYDPQVPEVDGVTARDDETAAVADAELVLSLNSSHDARTALDNALPGLRPGTVWADLNTAAPRLKRSLADTVAGRDIAVVDVALMAPVPGNGLHTPMVAAGDGAGRYADLLTPLGAHVSTHPGPAGSATFRKLLRSVFYKGLSAAVVEALTAAEEAGCEDWLREHIRTELAEFDARTLDRLVEGTYRHARRRTDEMTAATDQLHELGITPYISGATHDLLAGLRQGDTRSERRS